MTSSDIPSRLYRLVRAPEWRAAVADGAYRGNDMDAADGFIHLSTREQVTGTADRFFADTPDLMVLELDTARLEGEVKMEPADGQLFPHLYGTVPLAAVMQAETLPLISDGGFRFPVYFLTD